MKKMNLLSLAAIVSMAAIATGLTGGMAQPEKESRPAMQKVPIEIINKTIYDIELGFRDIGGSTSTSQILKSTTYPETINVPVPSKAFVYNVNRKTGTKQEVGSFSLSANELKDAKSITIKHKSADIQDNKGTIIKKAYAYN